MKIRSMIFLKRFSQDEMTVLCSPDEMNDIKLTQYSNPLMPIRTYVGLTDEPYEPDFTYGSNSYVVSQKPIDIRLFYVPTKDITLIQEADIDLDDH
ncbi:hypothetical protein [Lactobacillus paragasseri]|uniref:hypothetical protein n=1 Tax=Lactobacillus paragasseri TaxID=2107999 RepID=UPI001E3E641A|nr:hypothetical protein [Lactobacillus paragasseri]